MAAAAGLAACCRSQGWDGGGRWAAGEGADFGRRGVRHFWDGLLFLLLPPPVPAAVLPGSCPNSRLAAFGVGGGRERLKPSRWARGEEGCGSAVRCLSASPPPRHRPLRPRLCAPPPRPIASRCLPPLLIRPLGPSEVSAAPSVTGGARIHQSSSFSSLPSPAPASTPTVPS